MVLRLILPEENGDGPETVIPRKCIERLNRLLTGARRNSEVTDGQRRGPEMIGLILIEAGLFAILVWHSPPWRAPPLHPSDEAPVRRPLREYWRR
jgi:hypothetical protein